MLDYLLLTPLELVTNSGVLSAFAFAISIIALSFMAGEFFSMPSIKGFAKAEVYELGVSAVIVLIAIALVMQNGPFDLISRGFIPPNALSNNLVCDEWKNIHGTFDSASGTYTNGNIAFGHADYFLGCRPTQWTIASDFLTIEYEMHGVVLRKVTAGYMALMHNEMWMGLGSTLGINIVVPAKKTKIDVGATPMSGLAVLNEFNTFLVDFLGIVWSAFAGQKQLLWFVDESAMAVFLPFGLLLRAVPFTRKTGSTVIAVVFAAYFVYPLSILINYNIWEQIENPAGPAGCLQNGAACTTTDQCCSNECRAGTCKSVLTDFSEYRSIYSVCNNANPTGMFNALGPIGDDYTAAVDSYYLLKNPPSDQHWYTKIWGSIKNGYNFVTGASGVALSILRPFVMPNPADYMRSAMFVEEKAALDVVRFGFLAMVFIVMEIVLTMTLLKDFALLIGGEPRVLGLTRLV